MTKRWQLILFTLSLGLPFHALAQSSLFVEAPAHSIDPNQRIVHKINDSDSNCSKATDPVILPQAQSQLENTIAASVFTLEVNPKALSNAGQVGTSFLISEDLIMVAKHSLDQINPSQVNEEISITLANAEKVFGEKILHCSAPLDYCIIKMQKTKDGKSLGSLYKPLTLNASYIDHKAKPWIGTVANMNGAGLKASSSYLVKNIPGAEPESTVLHCMETSEVSSGGNSGAPVFDHEGTVIALDQGSNLLNNQCKYRQGSGKSKRMSSILADLKLNASDIYSKLQTVN